MSYSTNVHAHRRRWLEEHLADGVDDATLHDQEQAAFILDQLGFSAAANTMRPRMPDDGERIQDDWYLINQRLFGVGVPELPAPNVLRDELREVLGY